MITIIRRAMTVAVCVFILTLSTLIPAVASPRVESPSPQACTGPPSGPGEYAIVGVFNYPHICGSTVVLREGNTGYGRYHISIGGKYRNTTNHELTPYAMDRWQEALNLPAVSNPNPGFFIHRTDYLTPSGEARTMCVAVDLKPAGNYGQRGIVTAYWAVGYYSCGGEI